MVVIRGRLAPEVGAVLIQALAAARETLYQRARTKQAEDVSAGMGGMDVPAETRCAGPRRPRCARPLRT